MEEMQEALRGKHEFIDSCVLSVSACAFSNDSLDEQRDSSTIVSEFSSTKTLMNIEDSSSHSSMREFYLHRNFSSDSQGEKKDSEAQSNIKIFKLECKDDFPSNIKDSWLRSMTIPRAESSTSKKMQAYFSRPTGFSKSASQLQIPRAQLVYDESIYSESLLETVKKKSQFDKSGKKSQNSPQVQLRKRNTIINSKENPCVKPWPHDKDSKTEISRRKKECSLSPPRTSSTRRKLDDVRSKSESPSPTRIKRARMADVTREKSRSLPVTRNKTIMLSESSLKNKKYTNVSLSKKTHSAESFKFSKEKLKKHKKTIVMDFNEFPPPKSERKIQSPNGQPSLDDDNFSEHFSQLVKHPPSHFYLSPIEENSEASTSSSSHGKCSLKYIKSKQDELTNYTQTTHESSFNIDFDAGRKYHTYPKSRIPVPRKPRNNREFNHLMDPKNYPLEPREIDVEEFQQLHTADSQEELQEFLLLESQCSGNLGLATNFSTSEISDHPREDERGTMSGIF